MLNLPKNKQSVHLRCNITYSSSKTLTSSSWRKEAIPIWQLWLLLFSQNNLNVSHYFDFGLIANKRCQITKMKIWINKLFIEKGRKFEFTTQGSDLACFFSWQCNGTKVNISSEINKWLKRDFLEKVFRTGH